MNSQKVGRLEQAVETLVNHFNVTEGDAIKIVRHILLDDSDIPNIKISAKTGIRSFNTTAFIENLLETTRYNKIKDHRYKLHQFMKGVLNESDYNFIVGSSYMTGMPRTLKGDYK